MTTTTTEKALPNVFPTRDEIVTLLREVGQNATIRTLGQRGQYHEGSNFHLNLANRCLRAAAALASVDGAAMVERAARELWLESSDNRRNVEEENYPDFDEYAQMVPTHAGKFRDMARVVLRAAGVIGGAK